MRRIFILILLITVSTSARQQIPFGFFRAPTGFTPILESFENWSGGSPSLPVSWTQPYAIFDYAVKTSSNVSEGSFAVDLNGWYNEDWSIIVKNFDLTGATQIVYDLNYVYNCRLHIYINGVEISTQTTTGTNITLNISAYSGINKDLKLEGELINYPPTSSSCVVDNLRIN